MGRYHAETTTPKPSPSFEAQGGAGRPPRGTDAGETRSGRLTCIRTRSSSGRTNSWWGWPLSVTGGVKKAAASESDVTALHAKIEHLTLEPDCFEGGPSACHHADAAPGARGPLSSPHDLAPDTEASDQEIHVSTTCKLFTIIQPPLCSNASPPLVPSILPSSLIPSHSPLCRCSQSSRQ